MRPTPPFMAISHVESSVKRWKFRGGMLFIVSVAACSCYLIGTVLSAVMNIVWMGEENPMKGDNVVCRGLMFCT